MSEHELHPEDEAEARKYDVVDRPQHYTEGTIEVWDFIIDRKLDYLLGNVVKYVSRAGKKDPSKELEDLKKARAYLQKRIDHLEGPKFNLNVSVHAGPSPLGAGTIAQHLLRTGRHIQ